MWVKGYLVTWELEGYYFSITFNKRNTIISYGIIRYSHCDSNTFNRRETIIRYGIIRYFHFDSITSIKEKRYYIIILSDDNDQWIKLASISEVNNKNNY